MYNMPPSMSKGQQMILVALHQITNDAPDGMHRIFILSQTEPPLACHFGKRDGEFIMHGPTWANFTLEIGKILDKTLEIQVILQSFLEEHPDTYGDLDESTSAQNIDGWVVNQEGGMIPMRRKELMEIFPYRSDVQMRYKYKGRGAR